MPLPTASYRKCAGRTCHSSAFSTLLVVVLASSTQLFCQFTGPQLNDETRAVSSSGSAAAGTDQAGPNSAKSADAATTPGEANKKKQSRGSFVVAPIPISSPAIGSGVVPVVGYIFPFSKKDTVSSPSEVGIVGLTTNNGTRAFAVGGRLYLKENRYQATAVFVRGNINYDLYGVGSYSGFTLPLRQEGYAFLGEALRSIGKKFFLGPRFITGHSTITLEPGGFSPVPIPPDVGLQTTLTAIGVRLTRDTSQNRFYPTNGMYFNLTSDFFAQGLGSKYSFQSHRVTFAKYWGLTESQVLAYNANFCATGGSPPFYGNCIYGTNNQLRGYTAGKYFDRYMVASQLEYRLTLPYRLGVVTFGGLGEVLPGKDQLLMTDHFLPSGGGGLRFMLSKKYHVNLRVDIARGMDGHSFSMGIGEAF